MSKAGESLGTVARVIALLRLLAESNNDLTLSVLSEKMGLAPSTIHRLLALLTKEGLVGRNPASKTYYCAAEFVRISSLVLQTSSIADVAEPILQSLAQRFNESSMLCLYLEQQKRYTIAKAIHGTQLLRYDIQENTPLPLAWGASARSILAFLPQAEIDEILSASGPSQVSGEPIDERTYADLAATRERGYAFTPGQRVAGSVGLGAPFFGANGRVVGSICLTIPRNRFDPAQEKILGHALIEHAARLSHHLGFTGNR
ncbi:IclR family transcriptional regulator [Pollutimonas sp. H1-120]|uniref:IclR family transcriptional regulator n=1 Tax=Pollutimonas sp. H1-120 TaxID=3148824 RepID=UPI003B522C7F